MKRWLLLALAVVAVFALAQLELPRAWAQAFERSLIFLVEDETDPVEGIVALDFQGAGVELTADGTRPGVGIVSIPGGGPPSGAAGGDLTGSYPNPTIASSAVTSAKILDGTIGSSDLATGAVTSAIIADGTIGSSDLATGAVTSAIISDGTITDTDVAAANKDGSSGTACMRTLGTGGAQAAPGNDARFPTSGEKSALAGTSGTPGSGNRYVTDADSRMTDSRSPTAHASSHRVSGSDTLDFTDFHRSGTLASRPSCTTSLVGVMYFVTDDSSLHRCNGTSWVAVAPSASAGVVSVTASGPLASSGGTSPNLTWAPAADVSMSSHKLTSVTDPSSAQDAMTLNYSDGHYIQLPSSPASGDFLYYNGSAWGRRAAVSLVGGAYSGILISGSNANTYCSAPLCDFGWTTAVGTNVFRYTFPTDCSVSRLRLMFNGGTIASSTSWILTLMVNDVDTALTCTAGPGSNGCSDTTHSVSVSAGDTALWHWTRTGTPISHQNRDMSFAVSCNL